MEFTTFVYKHREGRLAIGEIFGEHEEVRPVAQHAARLLADGTTATLYKLEGSEDAVREILSACDIVENYMVSKLGTDVAAYIHYSPAPTFKRLMKIPAEHGLIVDTPLKVKDDGRMEVTVIGPKENISEAFEQVPEEFTLDIKRVGQYRPDEQNYFEQMSDRQQEVVKIAYEHGYYEEPRQATYSDIAAELDCSKGNVGEILRRVERTLVERMLYLSPTISQEATPLQSDMRI
jgi:predicted DNA binding protein